MGETILLAGCGNMGGAMLAGWLARGRSPADITIIDPAPARLPPPMRAAAALPAECPPVDVLVLAVKPQMLAEAAPAVRRAVGRDTILLSVLAAVDIATLRRHFPSAGVVTRAVPNLPAQIGAGITALAGEALDERQRGLIDDLCAPLGAIEWLVDESLCDAATSVSGCGPAFLFRYADAVARAGEGQGLDPAQARRLIAETMIGAGLMLRGATEPPAELARRVASPGGVTLAGLAILDRDDALVRLMGEALSAAARRNAEIAAEAREGRIVPKHGEGTTRLSPPSP